LESAIKVDLSKETVRLPLYKGKADGMTVWFVLLDASDAGLAHDLGVNYAPKLANLAINCPECVQTVGLESPAPADNRFGQAVVDFHGAPDFSPSRVAEPGPTGFPLAKFQPGAVAGDGYSPFIPHRWVRRRVQRADCRHPETAHSMWCITRTRATASSACTLHRTRGPAGTRSRGSTCSSSRASTPGQPIVYISTDAGQPLTSVLERSTYVPALDKAAYNGGDDFLGSARERLFGFVNGQSSRGNRQAQGFVHLVKDGHAAEDASADNTPLIDALRHGGDLLNVFGDFPTLRDPRHAQAYSPVWDAQLGLWTDKAVKAGLDRRQIDEVQVFNLAATRPDLLTGVDPATGKPAPYGAVGVDINCAVIGFIDKAPTANLAEPVPGSQFPPR
jgi:hypothetical protein